MRSRPAAIAATVALAAALLAACASVGPPLELRPGSTIQVVGVSKEFEQPGWEDARVGFGLRAALVDALAETGLFRLVEEKPEVAAKIMEAQELAWGQGKDLEATALEFGPLLDADYLAWARVVRAGSPRSSASLGVFHLASMKTEIDVEVVIKDRATGREARAPGRGSAERGGGSAIFEFREKAVALDASTVGIATRKAIRDAALSLASKRTKLGGNMR